MSSSNSILRLFEQFRCFILFVVVVTMVLGTANIAQAAAGDPGYLMINGQREFVMGWFKAGAINRDVPGFDMVALDESLEHGYKFIMHYDPWPPHGNQIYEWMLEAQARNKKIMVALNPPSDSFPTWTSMVNWVGHYGTTVPLKNLACTYGYYLEDEPDGRGLNVANLVAKYNEVKAADSNHLIFTSYYQDFAANAAAGYFAATDVAISELYTVSRWLSVAPDIAVCRSLGKKYLAAPWAADTASGKPTFTPAEFRFVTFSAIADGADGIMPFLFESNTNGLYDPNFKIHRIYPTTDVVAKIAPLLSKGLSGGISANCSAFESNGGRYVMGGDSKQAAIVAVNHGPALSNVTFTISGFSSDVTEAAVLGENRTITLTGPSHNQLVDSFDATYGVHVYKIRTQCQGLIDNGQGMAADFNGDCRVNFKDFASLAAQWLK
jgi:hypothetical protein